ncbi:hypothetical protein ABIF44_000230 [Bradyrhizobium japonicum]|jgi:hypothetical protein|nr:hypothetical protein [Bradyrhizobium japonicum]MCS3993464.1 hypothetical protein [Bradyrhizobium japonicum]MCS4020604.1 hypothetical protein [Bradyrhizobium japonicum]MCS4207713.1 hypothetical protein [Bradyrhizobium japonicum]MDH6177252.1 hypothetical protein [Bradyrhizobium japonicum]
MTDCVRAIGGVKKLHDQARGLSAGSAVAGAIRAKVAAGT